MTGWLASATGRAAAAPGGFPPLQQAQIVRLACTSPADAGRAWVRWSVQALHAEIARRHIATLHPSTVHRILQDADLHPHHIRYWRHSFDPAFESKAASVLWYYERVPWLAQHDELVVCLDEKTQIQALRRPRPDLPMRPGQDRRREWEYKREGTVNLLVAYLPITGTLWSRVLPKNDHDHFIEAVEAHLAQIPRTIRRIHYILDNGSSHIAADDFQIRSLLCRRDVVNRAPPVLALGCTPRIGGIHPVSSSPLPEGELAGNPRTA